MDTNLWNLLYDNHPNANKVISALRQNNLEPIISTHVIYELAKTFQSSQEGSKERGQELFRFIKAALDCGLRFLKTSRDLLRDEKRRVTSNLRFDPYYGTAERQQLVSEVEKLARGNFDTRADSFISKKKEQVMEGRQRARKFARRLSPQTAALARLQFLQFNNKFRQRWGRNILKQEIEKRFQGAGRQATWIAKKLMSNNRHRFANSLVRANAFINWRAAVYGSIPKDLFDDTFHIINSCYCAIYATDEQGQAGYAPYLIPQTRVEVRPPSNEVLEWLCNL